MTSWEIILVLGGVPLGIMAVLGALTLAPNLRRRPRYRPGEPWDHPPVWWTADPAVLHGVAAGRRRGSRDRAGRGGCRGDW